MAGEGTFPKSPGDILHSSEVNAFNEQSKNKTSYWSCPASNFHGVNPATANKVLYNTSGERITALSDSVNLMAPVFLPQGAIVTGVIVYGNDAAAAGETWTMRRALIATGTLSSMATASIDSEDTSISNATINNETYMYLLLTSSLDTSDKIYGARITYTTNYI